MRTLKYLFLGALITTFSAIASVNAASYVKDSDLTVETTIATGDTLIVYDTSAGNTVKATVSSVVASAANVGAATIVTTGALDTGSITSGFGTIDTGSSAITTGGDITGGTHAASADTAAGDNASIGYTSAEGLILTGQGSTSDVTIKNDADATVATVPTGTTNLSLTAGTVTLADGGTVSQGSGSGRATGVTLSTWSGQITTDDTSLAAGAEATFTVTNTNVTALDVIMVNAASGQTSGTSIPVVTAVASGSFDITLTNLHASTADTGEMVINFVILRGASS